MKKKRFLKTLATALLLCGGLTIGNLTVHAEGVVPIDEAHFPDPCFRQHILDYMDYNQNSILDDHEIDCIEGLELDSTKEELEAGNVVHSLEGLQYLSNIWSVTLYQQSLDSWDFSKWPNLTTIDIWNCPVTNLDFSNNPNLISLSVMDTPLTNLNVSNNPGLEYLICTGNKLTQLDISKNTALDYLELSKNQLTNIDISKNTALKTLAVDNNQLEKLDISNNKALQMLDCDNNQISELHLNSRNLVSVSCAYNKIKSLDISNCPELINAYTTIQPKVEKSEDGESIDYVIDNGDGTCSIPLSFDQGVQIITEPSNSSNDTSSDIPAEGFQDVPSDAWYKDAVKFVSEKGIMNGTSDTTFVPLKVLTRAEFVTVLHNMAGKPEMEYKDTFTDVAKKTWYTNPVMWAFENKVTSGISENEFGPDIKITREQLATMLLNYYGTSKLQINDTAISNFPDKDNVSDWAIEGVKWAVSNGIISGKPSDNGNILDPKGEATRAECAQMIMNLMSKLEN